MRPSNNGFLGGGVCTSPPSHVGDPYILLDEDASLPEADWWDMVHVFRRRADGSVVELRRPAQTALCLDTDDDKTND